MTGPDIRRSVVVGVTMLAFFAGTFVGSSGGPLAPIEAGVFVFAAVLVLLVVLRAAERS